MLETVYRDLLDGLDRMDVTVSVEDDYPDFKEFFVSCSAAQLNGSFTNFSLVLFGQESDSGAAVQAVFHSFFYTLKGHKRQRMMSSSNFRVLKTFVENSLFGPAGLHVI